MNSPDVPRWTCPTCRAVFHMHPYDIGSGPELCCPHCEWCYGALGQPLQPLDERAILRDVRAALEDR